MKLKISLIFTLMILMIKSLAAQATDTGKIEKMAVAGNQIIYLDKPIKVKMAADIALIKQKIESYNFLKKAQQISGWNVVWSIVGGYELGAGILSVAAGNPIAIIDIGIGAGLIAMVYKRRTNAVTYIQLGVNSFNK